MNGNLVYDVGMNNGDDTAYYLHLGYNVVAIEADQKLVEQAVQRFFNHIADGRLTILNFAIAEREGVSTFWICDDNPIWNSFDRSIASRNGARCHAINVECRRFDSVLEELDVPYYLKIDIEGHDHQCIAALNAKDLPTYISFELGPDNIKSLSVLKKLGFSGFKALSQWNFLPLDRNAFPEKERSKRVLRLAAFINSKAIIGKVIRKFGGSIYLKNQWEQVRRSGDWVFPMGSSGSFGPLTIGRWQEYDEFLDTIHYFQTLFADGAMTPYWPKGSQDLWIDIHARY
ncbi:MAG: FkbM family methyltransferase [Chloroflexota bacterium]